MEITFRNRFLSDWMQLTSGAESPPLFNLWTAISGIGAAAGRRYTLQLGRFTYIPNQYIILIGPAAVRKSSAGAIIKDILTRFTEVKFGPSDTGGQRQGLISEFVDAYDPPGISENSNSTAGRPRDGGPPLSKDIMNFFSLGVDQPAAPAPAPVAGASLLSSDLLSKARSLNSAASTSTSSATGRYTGPRELYVFADELGTFIGLNQLELINCITDIYYPKSEYRYKLARSSVSVHKPCLNLLACTTPTSLAAHMPPTAIGQGFSSRTLFIYEGSPQPKVFPAPALNDELLTKLGRTLQAISLREECKLTATDGALNELRRIYIPFLIIPFGKILRHRNFKLRFFGE